MRTHSLAVVASLALSACLGTTGNAIVHFQAAAAGPADAVAGAPLEFTNFTGWHVVLTKATLHVGAMYLLQTLPTSGGGPAACVLPGTYVAEVTTDQGAIDGIGIDVDLLSPRPKPFRNGGQGIDLAARAGQVWLTGVEVDQVSDQTTILSAEGTADRNGQFVPFVAKLTIGQNRIVKPADSTKPGSDPICRQRVVSPIRVDLVPRGSGTLMLRIDPRHQLFDSVDFSELKPLPGNPQRYGFVDDSSDVPSATLYSGLRGAGPLYQFSWEGSSP
jgi:hypothetical protein